MPSIDYLNGRPSLRWRIFGSAKQQKRTTRRQERRKRKMKNWKPILIENSKVPVWLSYLSPIDIWAINFGPFVWCRGVMNERTKVHETIHYQQQLELLFVGQWILYVLFSRYHFATCTCRCRDNDDNTKKMHYSVQFISGMIFLICSYSTFYQFNCSVI